MSVRPLFEMEKVGFAPAGQDLVADVSWRVGDGERWAVLGPNGCGKSTLLQLAIGTLWPTSGTVRRQGDDQIELPAFWRQIGWITDNLAQQIPSDECVTDTVLSGLFAQMGLKLFHGYELSSAQRSLAATELDRLGIASLATRRFGVLSRGERQKVMIARALVSRPICLILDEPCDGMDPGARERFLVWLGDFLRASGGPAVILVTHHMEEILPEFSHSLVLQSGRVVASGETSQVLHRETFEHLYGTRLARLERCGGRLWPIWGSASSD